MVKKIYTLILGFIVTGAFVLGADLAPGERAILLEDGQVLVCTAVEARLEIVGDYDDECVVLNGVVEAFDSLLVQEGEAPEAGVLGYSQSARVYVSHDSYEAAAKACMAYIDKKLREMRVAGDFDLNVWNTYYNFVCQLAIVGSVERHLAPSFYFKTVAHFFTDVLFKHLDDAVSLPIIRERSAYLIDVLKNSYERIPALERGKINDLESLCAAIGFLGVRGSGEARLLAREFVQCVIEWALSIGEEINEDESIFELLAALGDNALDAE